MIGIVSGNATADGVDKHNGADNQDHTDCFVERQGIPQHSYADNNGNDGLKRGHNRRGTGLYSRQALCIKQIALIRL